MWRVLDRWLLLCGAAFAAIGLAACGSGGSGSSGDPGGVVARVGGSVITTAMVDHALMVAARGQHLLPPRFDACVARLRAAPAAYGIPPAPNGAKPSVKRLRGSCELLYKQLRGEALNRLIVEAWTFGGAKELGVDIDGPAFQRKFAAIKSRSFPTQASFQSYLASSRSSPAEMMAVVRMELDSQAIRNALERRVGPMTPARVRHYYEHNKAQYLVPETRDLQIAGTSSRAAGLAVRRRIASGESFASVVKGLTSAQPVDSKDGSAIGLKSGFYREEALNQAIFTAKPGVLTGPIKTVIGYYVFEVKKIHHAFQRPLSAVAASLKTTLPEELAQQGVVAYIKHWRATWKARTTCSTGYVIPKCRQFKTTPATPPEDPYTLN